MCTNINAIKVCKLLYIWAIIYDFFYWIFLCIQVNCQKLQTSARRDVAPDANLFSHLVKFSKRGFIFTLSITHFRYQCKFISLQLFNLIFDILCQITPPPLLPITVFISLRPFKIQILPQIFSPSYLVKTKLNPHKSIFLKNQVNLMFSKNCGF